MLRRSQSGSQEAPPASRKPSNSPDLTTRSWRRINASPRGPGSERSPSKKVAHMYIEDCFKVGQKIITAGGSVPFLTAVDVNGGLVEDQDVSLPSTADQEVPHPDVLPDQSSRDFDFNEFFNLEKTMPGLASVSTRLFHYDCMSRTSARRGVITSHAPLLSNASQCFSLL